MSLPKPHPIHVRSDPARFDETAARYETVRTLEGRILAPELVRRLPAIGPDHPHALEWRMRADSVSRLERWIGGSGIRGPVMDLGCGPGWMTARLARRFCGAVGVDVVRSELERGAEAFAEVKGLELVVADVFEDVFPEAPFGLVVAASCAQYFPSLHDLLVRLLKLVRTDGAVVVLDTPFYRADEVEAARDRTRGHYRDLGVPEAASGYHHHTLESVRDLRPDVVYDPRRPWNRTLRRFQRGRSPFPIVVFRPGGFG